MPVVMFKCCPQCMSFRDLKTLSMDPRDTRMQCMKCRWLGKKDGLKTRVAFICPECKMVSFDKDDVANSWCESCQKVWRKSAGNEKQ